VLFALDSPWRNLLVAMGVGVSGALAVEAFRTVLFALEMGLVGAHDGHLVPAARELEPEIRLLVPAIGGPAVGMLLWWAAGRALDQVFPLQRRLHRGGRHW
jgi:hypothetical protein